MSSAARFLPLLGMAFLILLGCEVTEEKLELWKGTQNGPKKLASTVTDPDVPMNLRAKAAVALVDINSWDLFRESFQNMDKAESAKVAGEVAPILAGLIENGDEQAITKIQVDAKDALFILLDNLSGEGLKVAQRALISWCVGDYNIRAMAGQYNIRTIVKKIGAPAAEALIELLDLNQIVIKYVAELIREVGDPEVLAKASGHLAQQLKSNVDKIQETHLVSASIIGGAPTASALLEIAGNEKTNSKLQRFALRAYSEGLNTGNIEADDAQVKKLFTIAQNESFDQYHREETYYVIAQIGRKQDLEKLRKVLESKDDFWRAVAFRCILRMDGEGQLEEAISELEKNGGLSTEKEYEEITSRVASFPNLLPKVRDLLNSSRPAVQAVAVDVMAEIGSPQDAAAIEKLTESKEKLPKGTGHKTLGDAAKDALEKLKKRG